MCINSDKQINVGASSFFAIPVSTCGVGPILSRTTSEISSTDPACMKLRWGKLDGRVYGIMHHNPGASALPDGTEFVWSYDVEGAHGDYEELGPYAANADDLKEFKYFESEHGFKLKRSASIDDEELVEEQRAKRRRH